MVLPEALRTVYALGAAVKNESLPERTRYLVCLRASQINGCSFCVDMHSRELREAGETDERNWSRIVHRSRIAGCGLRAYAYLYGN